MYKAVLCDDDELIALGLSKLIPWESLGIELCGCCYDGAEAKKLVETCGTDILVSDVRMPFIDGLELTRLAKKKNPDIRVIIISGFDDFQYAREAIKLGAMDYLLKPINEDELISQLKRAVEACRLHAEQEALTQESQKYLVAGQLRCLLYEGPAAFRDRYGPESLQAMSSTACAVVVASIDNYEQLGRRLNDDEKAAIQESFYRCVRKSGKELVLFSQQAGTVACYLLSETPERARMLRDSDIKAIRSAFQTICPEQTLTFACSHLYSSIENLQKAYSEAMLALQERFVYSAGSVIYFDQLRRQEEAEFSGDFDYIHDVTELVSLIKQCDRAGVDRVIGLMQDRMLKIGGRSYLFLKMAAGNLFTRLFQDLRQYGISEEDLEVNALEEYRQITDIQSIEDAMKRLRASANRIMDVLERNNRNSYHATMLAAEKYISEHYIEHDLSMDTVARQVHMSPSYFSVVFKNEKGVSFTDYLIQLRIEKSKELIRCTDLKIYEISYRVGYDTAAYYSTAFKKATGLSPSEYKKSVSPS